MNKNRETSLSTAWFGKADNDLKNAEIVLREADAPLDTVCFHCQQAAEKYLKGYLTEQGVTFFRAHDLIYLLDLCKEKDASFGVLEDRANLLNDYAVETRYPFEEMITYSQEEAAKALETARDIKIFVLARIKS